MRGLDVPVFYYDVNLFGFNQSLGSETQSPNDMLVDHDGFVIGPPENEKDDLAVINPDELNNIDEEQLPTLPLADDCP